MLVLELEADGASGPSSLAGSSMLDEAMLVAGTKRCYAAMAVQQLALSAAD